MQENKPQNKANVWKTMLEHKLLTFLYFLIVLSITFAILYLFNLVPSEFVSVVGRYPGDGSAIENNGEVPLEIKIPETGVDAPVYNPESTSSDVLDDFLAEGAVRYPGSGLLGGVGNVFLFGHSSGLPIVHNQAYKTFNGLKELKAGDQIFVYSQNNVYVYAVTSVRMDKASNIEINFDVTNRMLTLTTCNVWGAKEDRYIVEATFVSESPIGKTSAQ